MALIKHTAYPPLPPRGFNSWQKGIQKEIDKFRKTNLAKRLKG